LAIHKDEKAIDTSVVRAVCPSGFELFIRQVEVLQELLETKQF
jgi:hypothetical protein